MGFLSRLLCGAALAASLPGVALAQATAPAIPESGVALTLPLVQQGRLHGDIAVELFADGRIRYDRDSLLAVLAPLLSPQGRERLAAALPANAMLLTQDVASAGVTLRYDSGRLEILVEQIDPGLVPLRSLGTPLDSGEVAITHQPEGFSAYLNLVGDVRLRDFEAFETPGLLAFGAVRAGPFVFEFDGGYDEALGTGGGFYRRAARLIYDQPDEHRRWSAGDVQLRGSSLLGGALLGGVAVQQGRRIFSDSGPLVRLGGQQVLLERDATVEIIVDGAQVQTLQLAAGPYDFALLQAQYGGRSTQFFVTDISGRRQLSGIDPYFDASDLAAGEVEYHAGIGSVASAFDLQPEYSGEPAFAGSYRRGLTNRIALGGALQVSKDIVVVGADVAIAPRFMPGRLEVSAAFSQAGTAGFALSGSWGAAFGGSRKLTSFSISGEYRDRNFTTLNDALFPLAAASLSVNGTVSRAVGSRTTLVGGFNYFDREGLRTTRSAYADILYRIRSLRLTFGAEYGEGFVGKKFGVRAAVAIPLGRRERAEASYNGRRDEYRTFVTRGSEDRVGSFGYDIGLRHAPGETGIDATADYVGNRFYSRLAVTSGGQGIGNITDRQFARLQIGTSIAYAGGSLAIGRPINDSFVIARAHPDLGGEQVVLGGSGQDRRFEALSGFWGAALGARLNSYSRQSITFDLLEGAGAVDIGSGIATVEPPYRSGYRLIVGTGATTTAYGFMNLTEGPAQLISGTVVSFDDPEFGTQPFFTNSVGRFAILGLRAGKSYEIRLNGYEVTHRFVVPADAEPLLQLGEVPVITPRRVQE